ncbi:MAG: Hsp20 family protein [Treponema sp.]|jgi:HSP20 family molecular chaperone IbpA|nr:Hsp20 family protein [Treponema sp.]
MKTPRTCVDLGTIFDELFDAAHGFRQEFKKSFNEFSGRERYRPFGAFCSDENTDYYPGFSYPPMNVYLAEDRGLYFEFALAGFDEKNISLAFQGDYMIFSARIEERTEAGAETEAPVRYLKRRLKLKDIDKQKYYVPQDKYAQERVRAVFKNGILRVAVPPRDEPERNGVRIEIVKEGP